jgi:hypothetical protein
MIDMAQVILHYSTPQGVVNRSAAEVDDLPVLREYIAGCIRTLICSPTLEDWRGWVLHVSNESGEVLFALPFSLFLGKPH